MKKLKDDTITKQKFFETEIKSNFNKNTRLILRDIISIIHYLEFTYFGERRKNVC